MRPVPVQRRNDIMHTVTGAEVALNQASAAVAEGDAVTARSLLLEARVLIARADARLGPFATPPSGRRHMLYDVAREVTDEVLGKGSYAEGNAGSLDPEVQAAIKRGQR